MIKKFKIPALSYKLLATRVYNLATFGCTKTTKIYV